MDHAQVCPHCCGISRSASPSLMKMEVNVPFIPLRLLERRLDNSNGLLFLRQRKRQNVFIPEINRFWRTPDRLDVSFS